MNKQVPDLPRLPDLSRGPAVVRLDTDVVSLVRGSSDNVLRSGVCSRGVVLVPIQPMHFSVVLEETQEAVELRLCPYTMCILYADDVCELNDVRCDDLLVIDIEPGWMSEIEQRCLGETASSPRPIDTLLHPDIPPIIHVLQRHLSFPECPHELYLKMLVELLVARFLWHRQRNEFDALQNVGLTDDKLHGVLLAIEEQLDRRILVAALARSVSMSASKFSREFKRAIGISPQRYILERRVLRVQNLLEQSDLSLADIALDVGFSSQAHMTARFAHHFGITPGEYRKHLSNDGDEPTSI